MYQALARPALPALPPPPAPPPGPEGVNMSLPPDILRLSRGGVTHREPTSAPSTPMWL